MMSLLTKEEKDKLVDQRMELMREKNEKRRQRQKEIEDEQRAMGEAAAPPTYIYESKGWREPEPKQPEDMVQSGDSRSAQWPGEKPQRREQEKNSGRGSSRGGRGGRGGRRDAHNQHSPSQNSLPVDSHSSPQMSTENWDTETASPAPSAVHGKVENKEVQSTPSPVNRGRGRGTRVGSGRLGGRGGHGTPGDAANRKETSGRGGRGGGRADATYESTRKQNYAAYEDEMKSQGGGKANTFLNDGYRDDPRAGERTNQEMRGDGEARMNRHPRNYGGGGDQVDLREKVREQRQHSARIRHDFNPEVSMTGKERQEHHKWKEEQAICDQKRLERAKKGGGQWSRPWDNGKDISNEPELPAEYGIYKDSESKRLSSYESPAMRGVGKGPSPKIKSTGRGRGRNRKSSQGESSESQRQVEQINSEMKVTIHTGVEASQASHSSTVTPTHPNSHPRVSPNQKGQQNASFQSRSQNQRVQDYNVPNQDRNKGRDTYNRQMSNGKRNGERRGGEVRGGATGDVERRTNEHRTNERRPQSSNVVGSEAQSGGRGAKGDGKSGGGVSQSANKNNRMPSGVTPKPTQPSQSSQKGNSSQAKASSGKQPQKVIKQAGAKAIKDTEEQEVIVTDEDDEDGWVDIDTDDDCSEEEEVTPRPSKEPTPARSNQNLSKESTPVPDSSRLTTAPAKESGISTTSAPAADAEVTVAANNAKDVNTTDVPVATEGSAKTESVAPVKAKLHIDIRDSVDDDEAEPEFLKTPEGGRQKIDWAAEMEQESPATTPHPVQDKDGP